MPTLPSGRKFGITTSHILEPGTKWFECPEGHFWYQTPDLVLNAPPFQPEQQIICDFVHAPCPTTPAEAERFVQVVEMYGDSQSCLTGMTLDKTDAPHGWSEDDCEAWTAWRTSPEVIQYLERAIVMCRAQAEANKRNHGPVTLRVTSPTTDESTTKASDAARERAVAIVRELLALEEQSDAARADDDTERLHAIYAQLKSLEQELDAMLDDPASSAAEAWHAQGTVCRILRGPDAAERAFLEAARLAPFALDPWLELTRVRGESGKLDLAEVAARRAVEVDGKDFRSWANLASVLVQAGKYEAAREPLCRALAINPNDRLSLHLKAIVDGGAGGAGGASKA